MKFAPSDQGRSGLLLLTSDAAMAGETSQMGPRPEKVIAPPGWNCEYMPEIRYTGDGPVLTELCGPEPGYAFIVADEYKLIVAVRERATPGELRNDIDIGRGKETGDEHG
jgi:hypothetical protein